MDVFPIYNDTRGGDGGGTLYLKPGHIKNIVYWSTKLNIVSTNQK